MATADAEPGSGSRRGEWFRTIFEHAATGIAITNLDGTYEKCNPAYCALLGYTEDDLRRIEFQGLVHPADRAANLAEIRRLLAGEVPHFEIENRYVHESGRPVWVRKWVSLLPNEAGRPAHLLALVTDVTERRRTEEAVRDSERRWRDLAEALPQLVWTCSADGRCDFLSRQWVAYTGRAEAEQLGYGWLDQVHPDDRDRLRSVWGEAVAAGTPFDVEFRIRRADGRHRWFKTRAVPVRGPDGQVARWFGSNTDIEDLKRATDELRGSEERLRAILDTAADAILTVSGEGAIRSVNPAAERMFGYAVAEMIGRNVAVLMPSPYREEHDRYLAAYRQTGVARVIGVGREVEARRKDGTVFPVELAVSETTGLSLFTGILHDLTRRKELEREVVELVSQEQLRIGQDLHDSVAQELTALNLLADDLAEVLPTDPAGGVKLVERMADGLRRSQKQLRAVLRGLVPVAVDAGGLMAALADLADRTDREAGVACGFDCPEPIPLADNVVATQVYLIAQEAVRNAVKHARPRTVRITLASNGHIVLRVRDDGVGMPAQAAQTQSLGLRIMRNRAAIIGATLTVGPAEPAGTVVTCELSRDRDAPPRERGDDTGAHRR